MISIASDYLNAFKPSKAHYRRTKAMLIARQTIISPHIMWYCAFLNDRLKWFVHLNLPSMIIMPYHLKNVKSTFLLIVQPLREG